jgi:hypothetical protein
VHPATGTCEHHDPAAPFGPTPAPEPYRWVTLALPALCAVAAVVVTAELTDGHHPRPAVVLVIWAALTAALWWVMAWVRRGGPRRAGRGRRAAARRPAVPESYLRRLQAQRAAEARQAEAGADPIALPRAPRAVPPPPRLEVTGPTAALAAAVMPELEIKNETGPEPEPAPPEPAAGSDADRARHVLRDVWSVLDAAGAPGIWWQDLAAALAEADPERWGGVGADAVREACAAKHVPSVGVNRAVPGQAKRVTRRGARACDVRASLRRATITPVRDPGDHGQ